MRSDKISKIFSPFKRQQTSSTASDDAQATSALAEAIDAIADGAKVPSWITTTLTDQKMRMPDRKDSKFHTVPAESMKQVRELCRSTLTDEEKLEKFQDFLRSLLPLNARSGVDFEFKVHNMTIIEVAAESACDPILLYMLAQDATLVNSPESLFATVSRSPKAVKQLLLQGHCPRTALNSDPELLNKLVSRAHVDTLQILVQEGVDLNVVVPLGDQRLPLLASRALSWNDDSFLNLVAVGCDASIRLEGNGYSILHVLVGGKGNERNDLHVAKIADAIAAHISGRQVDRSTHAFDMRLQAALDAGASVDAVDHDGRTAAHLAAEIGDAEKLGSLLEAGADPDVTDRNGQTALMLAKAGGHHEAAQVILVYKAHGAISDIAGASMKSRHDT